MLGLAVASSAVAGVNLKLGRTAERNNQTFKMITKDVKVKRQAVGNDFMKVAAKPSFRAPITEQPEGELRSYVRSGDAVFPSGQSLTYGTQSGRMDIVFADGGKVYMKNILYQMGTAYADSWVEGQLNEDGTQITVPMGQSVFYSDTYTADIVLTWGTTSVNGTSLVVTRDESVTEAVYAIDGETITLLGGVAPVEDANNQYWHFCATGLTCYWTDDNSFGGALEWNTVLTFTDEPVFEPTLITEQPEGELVEYLRTGDALVYTSGTGVAPTEQSGKAYIVYAPDGETVYLKNPLYGFPADTWVQGTVDGNKITVPTGQFLSWNTTYQYGLILAWGSAEVVATSDTTSSIAYTYYPDVTEITYTIDGNTISLDNSIGTSVNDGFESCTGLTGFWNDDLTWQGHIDWNNVYTKYVPAPASPADPTADDWYDSGAESGYTYFRFTLPTVDTEGNALDPEYLSYSIYTDNDQIFTFDAETYSYDLEYTGDLTEIPNWIYSGGYDFGTSKVYFYRTNAEGFDPMFTWRIGIQVHYTVNGVKSSSNIVYLEVFEKPQEGKLGDVNGDDIVDIEDVTALISKVLGNDPDPFIEENANIDGVGGLDIEDVTALITKVLGTAGE